MATAESTKTQAQILQEQHEAAASHHATVEDTVDEDDGLIPQSAAPLPKPADSAPSTNGTSNGVMSTKAAGKQKARDTPAAIDIHDEAAYPTLGSGPKPVAPPASSWGKKSLKSTSTDSRPSSASSTTDRPTSVPSAISTPPGKPQEYHQKPGEQLLPGQFRDALTVPNSQIDKTKNISKIIQDIFRSTKVKVERTTNPTERVPSTRFVATGTKKYVEEALKTISKELTIEQTKQVSIPAALKSHVIGRAGANVIQLEKKHDVKIQVQDRKAAATSGPAIAIVEIKGYPRGVEATERAIHEMVRERQPRVDVDLEDVPPQYFPFLAEKHADQIQRWEQDHDVKVQIPEYDPTEGQGQAPPKITVSGDHAAATRIHAELDRLAKQAQEQLKTQEQSFERSKHPYIVGKEGMSHKAFMDETGCVIVLPEDDSEDIIILGPENRLQAGADKAMELAAQIQHQQVDILKSFPNATHGLDNYARALACYLQERQLEKEIREAYSADLIFPGYLQSPTTWNVFASDNLKAMQARAELIKIIQAHPPDILSIYEVDPFFHPHLEELCNHDLRNEYGVHMIIPDNKSHVILVHEGDTPSDGPFQFPRQKPTAHRLRHSNDDLRKAENFIVSKTGEQSDAQSTISTQSFDVPKKHHDKVRKFVSTIPQPAVGFPVQVDYGRSTDSGRGDVRSAKEPYEDSIFLRGQGPQSVEDFMKKIMEKLKEIEEDEKTRSYTTSFAFPDKFKSLLIGKQGANINALREQYDVEIDTKEPEKVTVKGPQKHADACKAEISRLGKQWADEVTYKVKVEPRFFGSLIGKNGDNMTKLRNKVQNAVTIQLPPKGRSDDSRSVADTASDAGSHRNSRANQAPDEIVIRGPRQKADEIKSEIEELYKHIKDTSHEATVSVARDQVRLLLGRGGQLMDKLRAETEATIIIPRSEETDSSDRVTIRIAGSKSAVDKAKAELQKRSKAYDAVVTRKLNIDQKFHRTLIGSGGSNIRKIVTEAGGPENSAEAVQFPKSGSSTDEVTVSGTADVVDKIVAALEALVVEKDNETEDSVDVSEDQHHKLIGRGGETRQALEAKYKVRVGVPKRGTGTTVKILGSQADVAAAKEEILRRTAKPAGKSIEVPKSLHHTISNNGQLFRQLRDKKVVVDHGGQKVPPKSASVPSRSRPTNGSMPLITDDPDEPTFSWDVVDTDAATNGDTGIIPWILSGPPEEVDAALARIQASINTASEPRSTGYLILSNPEFHRHIIGRGGSKINEIRRKANCDIQVPKASGGGPDAITIVGDREGCEMAKSLIMEAVQRGQSESGGGRRSGSPRV